MRTLFLSVVAALAMATAGCGPQSPPASPVMRMALEKGVSPSDAIESLKLRANKLNMKQVGDLPLSDQVKAMTNKEQRLVRVFLFCDPATAQRISDANVDFAAYLPCRISIAQDKDDKIWLVMLNLAPLIEQIPKDSELRKEAEKVNESLIDIMKAGASGAL
jgi:uncharacterized protein (DUF302 family)